MGSESTSTEPVLDLESALARLDGDRELFADMAGYTIEDTPKLFEEIRTAVSTEDATAVRMKAHALKGLVAGCGGVRATIVAQSLEDAGHSGDLSRAESLVTSLEEELAELTKALETHRR